jgi:hypothetical protein
MKSSITLKHIGDEINSHVDSVIWKGRSLIARSVEHDLSRYIHTDT